MFKRCSTIISLPRPVVLISEKRIRRRISSLARRINSDYEGKELVLIYVSHGAVIFAADLARQIKVPMRIGSIRASSYSGRKSSGKVRLDSMPELDIKGKHVLVVDDILDSGRTLSKIVEKLEKLRPAEIRTCVLLDKKARRSASLEADYSGFEIPDVFVYGYGLDYDEYFRNLPYVACLRK